MLTRQRMWEDLLMTGDLDRLAELGERAEAAETAAAEARAERDAELLRLDALTVPTTGKRLHKQTDLAKAARITRDAVWQKAKAARAAAEKESAPDR